VTNGELQDWLQEYSRHLDVIVEVNTSNGEITDPVIESIDTTILDGESVLCVTVGQDIV